MDVRQQLEEWVIEKVEPLKHESRIVLRDPQRIIRKDARAVDGWADTRGFNVLVCSGNISFREWYESLRDDKNIKLLLVDQSRNRFQTSRQTDFSVFFPDFEAETKQKARLHITLKDFLINATDDSRWPEMVNKRNLSRFILDYLDGIIVAYKCLRRVDESRFTDADLNKIILGAMLDINPFRKPSPAEIRRLCIEQFDRLEEARRMLPGDVTKILIQSIEGSEPPFCWLLKRDPDNVIRAFTLSLVINQYDNLEPQLLIANFDSSLAEFRDISKKTLERAGRELIEADPDRLTSDVADMEKFLLENPERVKLMFGDLLKIHNHKNAFRILQTEKFSSLIRTVALAVLFADLLANNRLDFHENVIEFMEKEMSYEGLKDPIDVHQPPPLVLRRPTDEWTLLKDTYYRARQIMNLAAKTKEAARKLSVAQTKDLTFDEFIHLWNVNGLCKLDFFLSDLYRTLRLDQANPLPDENLHWEEFGKLWKKAREQFKIKMDNILQDLGVIDRRFQDLYAEHYVSSIRSNDAPVIFTHQFIPRFLKKHWDPKSGPKAYILIFDGLRVDAWQEFLLPVFAERFEVIEEMPGSAIIPTETNLTRKAISAGCLPIEFVGTKENDLLKAAVKKHLGTDINLKVEKEDDDVAAGITIRYISDRLEMVIFNFTDKKLHNETSDLAFLYRQNVQPIISQDVRSVLRKIEDDALIFVTSDHGFIPTSDKVINIHDDEIADNRDVKTLNARLQSRLDDRRAKETVQFEAMDLGIPAQTKGRKSFAIVAFPRPKFILKRPKHPRPPDKYTHGGISMAECLIPVVCLGPKPKDRLPVYIYDLQLLGSLMEGDEVALILNVAGTARNVRLLISVDQEGIQERTEFFSGGQRSYRIGWRLPVIDTPEQDEIEAGSANRIVTVTVRYHYKGKSYRTSKTIDVKIHLDSNRLRRRISTKLDIMLGMIPKGLR